MYIETIFGGVCSPSPCHDELSYLTVKMSFQKLQKSRQTGGWIDGQTNRKNIYTELVSHLKMNEHKRIAIFLLHYGTVSSTFSIQYTFLSFQCSIDC